MAATTRNAGATMVIDGSEGEGGGQILRTALSLSMVTGRPFRIEQVRAKRSRPGLLRQHLTAVRAAAAVSGAEVSGDELGSRVLTFAPGAVRGGSHEFRIGSAGSATLVLQTVLPALLLRATGPSSLLLEGGTHNPLAPSADFLDLAFLPLLRRMGARVQATLGRHGFYPAGGGQLRVEIEPVPALSPLRLPERGAQLERHATVLLASLPFDIARRELAVMGARLGLGPDECRPRMIQDPLGPGNVVQVMVASEHVTELFSACGEKGLPAEEVAERVAGEAAEYLASDVPVGRHLADQLLLPMALAGGGSFRTLSPTQHTRTQATMITRFLDVKVRIEPVAPNEFTVEVSAS